MILALVLGCTDPVCTLTVPVSDRECVEDIDCALVYTDCAQECSCAAVNAFAASGYEGKSAADCGDGCEIAPCDQDCKETHEAICRRNVCESVSVAGDTFEL